MPVWPVSLPKPLAAGFRETLPVTTIRTEMEQGPAKVRRRTTAAIRKMSMSFLMTKAEIETLENFFLVTVAGGAIAFDFTHPRTGSTVSCRLTRPPEYGANNGTRFQIDIEMEVLP